MAQHISRKELKTDEVHEALSHSAEAFLSHKKAIIYGVIIAAIIVGAFYGWKFHTERQSLKASAGFSDAMQVFQAPVVAPGQPPQPNEITYSNETNKYQDALKKFQGVASQYPRTRFGQLSLYYSALCDERLNQDAKAVTVLSELQNGSNTDFADMARFELAQIYDREGKGTQAVQLYNQLLNNPSVFVPKPVVLLALAGHYRQSDPQQAARLYNQIKTQYPATGAADQADQELALLPGGKS